MVDSEPESTPIQGEVGGEGVPVTYASLHEDPKHPDLYQVESETHLLTGETLERYNQRLAELTARLEVILGKPLGDI